MIQKELAKELGVSEAYISMVLSGRKNPSKRIAEKLTNLVNSEAKGRDLKSVGLRPLRVQIPPSAHYPLSNLSTSPLSSRAID